MKKHSDIPFLNTPESAPRTSWGRRPKPPYYSTEQEIGKALALGLILGMVLMLAFCWLIYSSYDRLDYNRDGKVSATDLLQVKRLELQIRAHILGLPDPFVTVQITDEPIGPVDDGGAP